MTKSVFFPGNPSLNKARPRFQDKSPNIPPWAAYLAPPRKACPNLPSRIGDHNAQSSWTCSSQGAACCCRLASSPTRTGGMAGWRPGGSLPQGGYGNQQPPHNPPLASESVEELRAPSDQIVGLLPAKNGWTVKFCALAKLSQPVFNPVGQDHSWIFRLITEQAEANMDQDQSCLVFQPMGELRRVKTSMKRTNERVGGWLKERKGIVGRFYAKKVTGNSYT